MSTHHDVLHLEGPFIVYRAVACVRLCAAECHMQRRADGAPSSGWSGIVMLDGRRSRATPAAEEAPSVLLPAPLLADCASPADAAGSGALLAPPSEGVPCRCSASAFRIASSTPYRASTTTKPPWHQTLPGQGASSRVRTAKHPRHA